MDDDRFRWTVVVVLSHDSDGTLGVVLNAPESVSGPVNGVLSPWLTTSPFPQSVYRGGPVQEDGFVCLVEDSHSASGLRSVDFLTQDPEPGRRHRIFRGHSGWTTGQLAAEIDLGVWMVITAQPDDLFTSDPEGLWSNVLRRQGEPLSRLVDIPRQPWLN